MKKVMIIGQRFSNVSKQIFQEMEQQRGLVIVKKPRSNGMSETKTKEGKPGVPNCGFDLQRISKIFVKKELKEFNKIKSKFHK